jgi:T5SS/PEP-CTERM-associated repeat protein
MRTSHRPHTAARRAIILGFFAALCIAGGRTGVVADEMYWTEPSGGSFHDPVNWDPSVPGSNDAAIFDMSSFPAYFVTFGSSAGNSQCIVRNDAVDMDLGGNTYSLSGDWGLVVAESWWENAELSMTDGIVQSGNAVISLGNESFGLLALYDGLSMQLSDYLAVGHDGYGVLPMMGGATIETDRADVGVNPWAEGYIEILDPDTALDATASLRLGVWGTGTVSLEGGGTASANELTLGLYGDSTGNMSLSDEDTAVTVTDGLLIGEGGTGELAIYEGAEVSALWARQGYGYSGIGTIEVIGPDAKLSITDNVSVGVYGEGSIDLGYGGSASATTMNIGWVDGGRGKVTLAETDTMLTIHDGLYVGDGGNGELTIDEQAMTEAKFARVGASATGDGQIHVNGSGSMLHTTESLYVGANGHGRMHVDGGGEVRTLEPPGWIVIADDVDSYGEVSVQRGSMLSADHAPIVVGSHGAGILDVGTGGVVFSDGELFAGTEPTGSAAITISGAGSRYESNSVYPTMIGDAGTATVTITSGGELRIRSACLMGYASGGEGSITLADTGSTLETPVLLLGRQGDASLTINDGRVALGVDATSVPAGELHIGAGSELGGTGTIHGDVVNLEGTIWPGGTVGGDITTGILDISGSYRQEPDGALNIELGGTALGSEYCALHATESVELDGELSMLPVSGFVPQPGDVFEIISAGSVDGEFSIITGDEAYCAVYEPDSVLVSLAAPGDCDQDCDVDGADYTTMATCVTGPDGGVNAGCDCFDIDGDDDVDLHDMALFQVSFGG